MAKRRSQALTKVRTALQANDTGQAARIYAESEDILATCRSLKPDERERINAARQDAWLASLRAAITQGSEQEIVRAGNQAIRAGCLLDAGEYTRIQQARHVLTIWPKFEQAIAANDDLGIISSYNASVLGACSLMTDQHRQRVTLAQRRIAYWPLLKQALASGDDERIAEFYEEGTLDGLRELSADHRNRCELALRRVIAYRKLKEALRMDGTPSIVEAYDQALLAPSSLLAATQRRRLSHTLETERCRAQMEDALRTGDPLAVIQAQTAALTAKVRLPDDLARTAAAAATQRSVHLQRDHDAG